MSVQQNSARSSKPSRKASGAARKQAVKSAKSTKAVKPDSTAADHLSTTDDLRISHVTEMISPEALVHQFPLDDDGLNLITNTRQEIRDVLTGKDDRLVVVVGPCSIHDTQAGLEYAQRLAIARETWKNDLLLVMRVYFEKPRTVVGWKGLINDPHINNTFCINEGLPIARKFLLDVTALGVPCAVEFLDLIIPQYLADVVSWGAIGARTTESQGHRELGSGLSCPLGFKNGTGGNIQIAADAVRSARSPHHFISIKKDGKVATFQTIGNKDSHIVLRGGQLPDRSYQPNYDRKSVANARAILTKAGLPEKLMIDFSHANSKKDHRKQKDVCQDVAKQLIAGENAIFGAMIESHLVEGRQEDVKASNHIYGQSITDACVCWDNTELMFEQLAKAVRIRRNRHFQDYKSDTPDPTSKNRSAVL